MRGWRHARDDPEYCDHEELGRRHAAAARGRERNSPAGQPHRPPRLHRCLIGLTFLHGLREVLRQSQTALILTSNTASTPQFWCNHRYLLHFAHAQESAFEYMVMSASARTVFLAVNISTWHVDQDLFLSTNATGQSVTQEVRWMRDPHASHTISTSLLFVFNRFRFPSSTQLASGM